MNINTKLLKALALCAGYKNDLREYLKGVHAIGTRYNDTLLVATNGHLIAFARIPIKCARDVTIPTTAINSIKTTAEYCTVDAEKMTITYDNTTAVFSELYGTFPSVAHLNKAYYGYDVTSHSALDRELLTLTMKAMKLASPHDTVYSATPVPGERFWYWTPTEQVAISVMPLRVKYANTSGEARPICELQWLDCLKE